MVNRNEPATKFFGPNYPFIKSVPPTKVIVQLHNLQPGQHWRPIFAALVHKKVTLLPVPFMSRWQHTEGPFRWQWFHRLDEIHLAVTDFLTPCVVFDINLNFLETRWMLNENRTAPGNYAFLGTATLSWKDVPRQ